MFSTTEVCEQSSIAFFRASIEALISQVRNNLILLIDENRVGPLEMGIANLYDYLDVGSARSVYVLPVPFIVSSKDSITYTALCRRTRPDGSDLCFSLEGFKPLSRDQSGNYKFSIPLIILDHRIPIKEEDNLCRYLGMQVSVYVNPDRACSMTIEYKLGYFEVDTNPENKIDLGFWTRFRSTVRFVPLRFHYRGTFKPFEKFTADQEDEGKVCRCIEEILEVIEE